GLSGTTIVQTPAPERFSAYAGAQLVKSPASETACACGASNRNWTRTSCDPVALATRGFSTTRSTNFTPRIPTMTASTAATPIAYAGRREIEMRVGDQSQLMRPDERRVLALPVNGGIVDSSTASMRRRTTAPRLGSGCGEIARRTLAKSALASSSSANSAGVNSSRL